MASPKTTDDDALQTLDALVQTTSALLTQLQSGLAEIQTNAASPSPSSTAPPPALDVFSLAHDAATLIRAHGTKISLLVINEPFTPSAISTILRELAAGPIPALASAAQACLPDRYTETARGDLVSGARRVLSALRDLVDVIPRDGKILRHASRTGRAAPHEKGSFPATGLLWSACDNVTFLSGLGVARILEVKIEQWRNTLEDIMTELKEWADEEPDDDDDDDDDDDSETDHLASQLDAATLSPQDLLDQIMDSPRAIPKSDPHRIRPRLENSIRRLRLVILLYKALCTRRLRKLPPLPIAPPSDLPARLDQIMKLFGALPDQFGDLASAFYELEPCEIDRAMDQCFSDAFAVGDAVMRDWEGDMDGFSDWVVRFQAEVTKA